MITVLIFFGFVACELEMRRGAQWPIIAFAAIGTLGGQDALAMRIGRYAGEGLPPSPGELGDPPAAGL